MTLFRLGAVGHKRGDPASSGCPSALPGGVGRLFRRMLDDRCGDCVKNASVGKSEFLGI